MAPGNGSGVRRGVAVLYLGSMACLLVAPAMVPEEYWWVTGTASQSAAQGTPGAWVTRLGFLCFGLAVMAEALTVRWWPASGRFAHVTVAVCLFAVAAFAARPADSSLPFDPTEDLLHAASVTLMQVAFAGGVLILAWFEARDGGGWNRFDVVVAAGALLIPLVMAARPEVAGVVQRVGIGVALTWYLGAWHRNGRPVGRTWAAAAHRRPGRTGADAVRARSGTDPRSFTR